MSDFSTAIACLITIRSPLRTIFDSLLTLAIFLAYIPQFTLILYSHTPSTRLPRAYIMHSLLFLSLLNTSHFTGFATGANARCVGLGVHGPADFFGSWESAKRLIGVAQVAAIWWGEFGTCICYIIASRPGVAKAAATRSERRRSGDGHGEERKEAPDLGTAPASSVETETLFGRAISAKQSFYINLAATALIWCFSTYIYTIAERLSRSASATDPSSNDDEAQTRGTSFFITVRILTILTFPLPFLSLISRLRAGKPTGLSRRSLQLQVPVLLLIGLSLAQMVLKSHGWWYDWETVTDFLWKEGAGTVLALAVVRDVIAMWMARV